MKQLSLLVLVFLSSLAMAEQKAPDFFVTARRDANGWLIDVTPPAKHHVNTHAPMSLKSGKLVVRPRSATEKAVHFALPATSMANVTIALYLCDDAQTYCEKHEVVYALSSSHARSRAKRAADGVRDEHPAPSNSLEMEARQKTLHGFILNDPEAAFAQARRESKPLMIDFFGIWCPPCNELDEKVFSTTEFASASARFVRLKLDADSPISWKLKSRYRVTGYPTVVFATAEGDEISRIIGFRPGKEFIRELDDAWKNRRISLAKLEAQAAAGDREAADRAGVIRYHQGDSGVSARLLAGSKAKREYWHLAEIETLENEGAPSDQRIARINQAIREYPGTPNTIDWYAALAKIYDELGEPNQRKAALARAIHLAVDLSNHPESLTGYDATSADLLETEAAYREELDGKDRARKDWLAAARAYALRGVGPAERANHLEMAYCLGKAGEFEKAREIYRDLEKIYPNEFTFYFNHARMEKDANRLADALRLGDQALRWSYGDNRLRTAKTVADIQVALGRPELAKKVIDETLATTELPSDRTVRTHRYADELKKLRASLK